MSKQAIWESTFGSAGDTFSWWREVTFESGDWDVIGRVTLGVEDPEDEEKTVTKTVGIVEVMRAARIAAETCVDACTGRPIAIRGEDIDWDACVADCVLQIAVLGEVVYG